METEILIERFLAGERRAFEQLADEWHKPVYNFCLRFLGNTDKAEDAAQLTFIRVYRKLPKLENPEKFRAWIFQIARNLCIDAARKQKGREISNDELNENTGNPLMTANSNPHSQLEEKEMSGLIKRILQKIPAEQREVIVLKIYHNLKFIEIAEILQISINTVKARMYSGLKKLRPLLAERRITEEYL